MPTNKNADLKQNYHKLLMLKHENETLGIKVHGLDKMILESKSTMDLEDVSYVDKQFNEWLKSQ